jgi:hypothetical protein
MKRIAAAAVLTAALVMSASQASAATHACNRTCTTLISPQLPGLAPWVVVPGSGGHATHAKTGDQVAFRARSTRYSNEDFSPVYSTETVSWYCLSGPQQIRGRLCTHDGRDIAQEMQWIPDGYETGGLCAGVARPAHAGEHVTLQPCGRSPRTLWIADGKAAAADGSTPLINGASGSADPLVLAVSATGTPRNALVLEHESTVTAKFDFIDPCQGLDPVPAWCKAS